MNSPPFSLPEGSDVGLWCRIEEWVTKGKCRVDSCGVKSGEEAGGATLVSVVEDFDCPDAGGLYFYFLRCLRCLKG